MDYSSNNELPRLETARRRLATLEQERVSLLNLINRLEGMQVRESRGKYSPLVTNVSSQEEKIVLFRSLFRGREDVYALRFESARTGRSGYQPACKNEWVGGLCKKPRIKCNQCKHRDLLPLNEEVTRSHLLGRDSRDQRARDFVIGVYPLLPDNMCWFLAVDFDKTTWADDVKAFAETCRRKDVPVTIERSRSGNGAHAWIFFDGSISASLARRLGSAMITETMEERPEMGLDSYDRLFPSQDTMPKGNFGNLIALPFQRKAVPDGNTLFVDEHLNPFPDQWGHLSSLKRMSTVCAEHIADEAFRTGRITGVKLAVTDETEEDPWTSPPSRRVKTPPVTGPLPERVSVVLGNEIYIEKKALPPGLINRLIRIAAFQNPEFYKKQGMRLPTFKIPRIVGCAEDCGQYLGLPIGCLDEIVQVLRDLGIKAQITDERESGKPILVEFIGKLRSEQEIAAQKMLRGDTGVLAATTAFGKTIVAIYLLARRGVNTLILVHRKQLMDQWIERLATFLNIDVSVIGSIGGGKRKPTGIIDVALIQSLCRKGVVDDCVAEYGHLIVDECHWIAAPSFEQVARRCKARYIAGLSATAVRKDGHHPIIFMQCGPMRYRSDARKEAGKRPFDHKVIVRNTAFSFHRDENVQIHELYAALVSDEKRNAAIVKDVLTAVEAGRSPVLLTERRKHVDLLKEMLTGAIENLIVLTGGMGSKQRRAATQELAAIPSDEQRVILATGKYLGEGFDDARLDTLFLVLPISWRGTLAQYAGRLHREHDMKKEVVIYDYADVKVPMLERMFSRRLRGYLD